jgi:hypothetical protein
MIKKRNFIMWGIKERKIFGKSLKACDNSFKDSED